MPDLLAQTLALPGLWALVTTVFVAGAVYGFAGFGAALIFMPVASTLVPFEVAVAAFAISAVSSLVTVLPRAWGQVDRRGVAVMIVCATLSASLGLWVLRVSDLIVLRWTVIAVTASTLLALCAGWRYATPPTVAARSAIGFATGFVGGATGLLGPVMVLFQLAGRDSVATSRATALVFLTLTSLLLVPLMAMQGLLTLPAVVLGLILLLPYGAGARLGAVLFRPGLERFYRSVAYFIILVAIILGLPVWD
ncbi:sulfite exporter TauE/SafE family protein [Puniceibacterium confluentis]|uniref:sulfite exporter TauE/SafE family protein n=1 Tax=Puniceibacterium confluentis TaxID=1958944 RepID=UPI00356A7CA0